MTGHTRDDGNGCAFVVLGKTEIFFVDLPCHFVHMTGDVLLRFGVAGKIQMVRAAVRRRGVTEITVYTQRRLPAVHDLVQVFMTDILRKDLEVLRSVIRRGGGGHSDDHQSKKRGESD